MKNNGKKKTGEKPTAVALRAERGPPIYLKGAVGPASLGRVKAMAELGPPTEGGGPPPALTDEELKQVLPRSIDCAGSMLANPACLNGRPSLLLSAQVGMCNPDFLTRCSQCQELTKLGKDDLVAMVLEARRDKAVIEKRSLDLGNAVQYAQRVPCLPPLTHAAVPNANCRARANVFSVPDFSLRRSVPAVGCCVGRVCSPGGAKDRLRWDVLPVAS